MSPASICRCIISSMRFKRSVDMPTFSGFAVGNSAAAITCDINPAATTTPARTQRDHITLFIFPPDECALLCGAKAAEDYRDKHNQVSVDRPASHSFALRYFSTGNLPASHLAISPSKCRSLLKPLDFNTSAACAARLPDRQYNTTSFSLALA